MVRLSLYNTDPGRARLLVVAAALRDCWGLQLW